MDTDKILVLTLSKNEIYFFAKNLSTLQEIPSFMVYTRVKSIVFHYQTLHEFVSCHANIVTLESEIFLPMNH
jgi:hypothetical protein